MQLISLPNPNLLAGYKITISLGNDADGNVDSVTFAVVDNLGHAQPPKTIQLLTLQLDASLGKPPTDPQFLPGPVTQQDLAAILAFELDLVGPTNGESAGLTSGAATITYAASDILAALNHQPACTAAQGVFTAENANGLYGTLLATPSLTLAQSFNVNTATPTPMMRRLGTPRASTRRT